MPASKTAAGTVNATPPKQQLLIGLAATVTGLAIVAVAARIIPASEQSFHAPHWVVGIAGLAFVFVGALFLTPLLVAGFAPADEYTVAQKKAVKLIQQSLGCLLLTSLAAVPLWIGFGPGERIFSYSMSFFGLTNRGAGSETMGRVLFGVAGISIGLWAVFTWAGLLRTVFGTFGRSNDDRNQK
jgi:hypothetical protein